MQVQGVLTVVDAQGSLTEDGDAIYTATLMAACGPIDIHELSLWVEPRSPMSSGSYANATYEAATLEDVATSEALPTIWNIGWRTDEAGNQTWHEQFFTMSSVYLGEDDPRCLSPIHLEASETATFRFFYRIPEAFETDSAFDVYISETGWQDVATGSFVGADRMQQPASLTSFIVP